MEYLLRCTRCRAEYDRHYQSQICVTCGGIMEVVYSHSAPFVSGDARFWGYAPVLPRGEYRHYKVGSTTLMQAQEPNLYLKLELENPTRSFKDRGSVIEVAKAHEYGYRKIVCASTGNMAYSIAYYSKLYGLRTKVFVSRDANKDKVRDIRETHDADVTHVDGDFTKAQGLAERYAQREGAFLAGDYCYRKEGQSTIAYEVLNQLPDAKYLIVPVGNATLLGGVLKALRHLKAEHQKLHIPKVIGVQSSSCKPFVKAFSALKPVEYVNPATRADAIAVGLPTFGESALDDLRFLEGSAITVSDTEMKAEQKRFAERYGLVAELAAVASVAAYRKLRINKGEKAVAIISGGNV